MQDRHVIMNTGFKNIAEAGATSGFQLNIRVPYYRGIFLSSVHTLELAVDGEGIPAEKLRISLAGRTFTIAAMYEADDVRWGFGDPATLLVARSGGLNPGIHAIRLAMVIRKSYLPATDPQHLYEDFPGLWKEGKYLGFIEGPTVINKRMTLVQ